VLALKDSALHVNICGGILFHAVIRVPHSKREKVSRDGFSLARIFSLVSVWQESIPW
jgi:hypothetical protein